MSEPLVSTMDGKETAGEVMDEGEEDVEVDEHRTRSLTATAMPSFRVTEEGLRSVDVLRLPSSRRLFHRLLSWGLGGGLKPATLLLSGSTISWSPSKRRPEEARVPLDHIEQVIAGQTSKAFARFVTRVAHAKDRSMSVVYHRGGKQHVLDVVFLCQKDFELFRETLESEIAKAKQLRGHSVRLLKRLWERADVDGSNTVSKQEFQRLLKAVNLKLSVRFMNLAFEEAVTHDDRGDPHAAGTHAHADQCSEPNDSSNLLRKNEPQGPSSPSNANANALPADTHSLARSANTTQTHIPAPSRTHTKHTDVCDSGTVGVCRRRSGSDASDGVSSMGGGGNKSSTHTHGGLSFENFTELIQRLRTRPELSALWAHLLAEDWASVRDASTWTPPISAPVCHYPPMREAQSRRSSQSQAPHPSDQQSLLPVEIFREFLVRAQGEALSLSEARKLLQGLDPHGEGNWLSFERFVSFMASDANDVLDPAKVKRVYQDMTQPLHHYFIASSHNTYLEGDQLQSASSVLRYIHDLCDGCRCVEIDCWNGSGGEPIVYHGKTLTGRLLFRDVIVAVNEHAFVHSPYPVVLSIENHCDVANQQRMAEHLINILGDKLYRPSKLAPHQLASPEDLRYKVIVKTKRAPLDHEESSQIGGCTAEADPLPSAESYEDIVSLLPDTHEHAHAQGVEGETTACVRGYVPLQVGRGGGMDSGDENGHVCADTRTETIAKIEAGPTETGEDVSVSVCEGLRKENGAGGDVCRDVCVDAGGDRDGLRDGVVVGSGERGPRGRGENVCLPGTRTSCSPTKATNKPRAFSTPPQPLQTEQAAISPTRGRRLTMPLTNVMIVRKKHTKKKVIPALAEITWMAGSGFRGWDAEYACNGCMAVNETKMEAWVASYAQEWVDVNKRTFSRVYPANLRVDSSNYSPIAPWNVGTQLVALNYQTPGLPMQLNRGKFRDNGGVGYVLKPPYLRDTSAAFHPTKGPFPSPVRLTITIISGQQLPKPQGWSDSSSLSLRPFVRVAVHGVPPDTRCEVTPHVVGNGFNPVWHQTLTFDISAPELALLSLTVYHKQSTSAAAAAKSRFANLVSRGREGYVMGGATPTGVSRHVAMFGSNGAGTGTPTGLTHNIASFGSGGGGGGGGGVGGGGGDCGAVIRSRGSIPLGSGNGGLDACTVTATSQHTDALVSKDGGAGGDSGGGGDDSGVCDGVTGGDGDEGAIVPLTVSRNTTASSNTSSSDFIASTVLPVSCIREGYRRVQLSSYGGCSTGDYEYASLFVHTTITATHTG